MKGLSLIRRVAGLVIVLGLTALMFAEVRGEASGDRFQEANRLYEQGRYEEAVVLYEDILQEGVGSAALFYNLGNSYFRSGQPGLAIVQYRRALALDPRDPDILANLQFARDQVSGTSSVFGSPWVGFMMRLRVGEWGLLGLVGVWLTFGLLAAGQWRPGLKRRLKPFVWIGGLYTLGVLLVILWMWREVRYSPLAVVLEDSLSVRYGPVEESQSFFIVSEGTELKVEGEQGDWVRVQDAAQRSGWVRRSALWMP